MNDELHDVQLIERYLQGTLPPEEQARVEERLRRDEDFREEVQLTKVAIRGVEEHGLKDMFQTLHRKHFEEPAPPSRTGKHLPLSKYGILGVAASVIIIITAGIFFWKHSPKDAYAHYFDPYQNVLTFRLDEHVQRMTNAMHHYDQHEYAQAVVLFGKIAQEASAPAADRAAALFYQGVSYLAVNEFDQALASFQRSTDPKFSQQIAWYMALCYLYKDDFPTAIRQLKKIRPDDFKYDDAQRLLRELQ